MYPTRTPIMQFETRDARLAREHLAIHRADSKASSAAPAPPRFKLAILTWVSAYALITTFLALLGPSIAGWPLALRTLFLSVTMVATLTWVIMPRLTRLFRPWLAG
jgi:antibiotic biosynthesis monooxygenase (ABM) superfamily enzyme